MLTLCTKIDTSVSNNATVITHILHVALMMKWMLSKTSSIGSRVSHRPSLSLHHCPQLTFNSQVCSVWTGMAATSQACVKHLKNRVWVTHKKVVQVHASFLPCLYLFVIIHSVWSTGRGAGGREAEKHRWAEWGEVTRKEERPWAGIMRLTQGRCWRKNQARTQDHSRETTQNSPRQ